METIAIYLAGTIKKDHEEGSISHWTNQHKVVIQEALSNYHVSFLNPASRSDDLSDQHSVFGRDMIQVFTSDVVFVDAREKRGLGVGAEMMWAKMHQIPVVIWAPVDSHYRKSKTEILGVAVENWVHPFVESLGDVLVDHLEEGARWIDTYMQGKQEMIKDREMIFDAMRYYRKKGLPVDSPMEELIEADAKLENRVQTLKRDAPSIECTL